MPHTTTRTTAQTTTWTMVALAGALAGCSGFIDKKAAESTLKILERSSQAAARQTDVQLAREALPGGIIQLESFALAYPGQKRFREMHADALCQYAVAFVFDDWEDASMNGRRDDAERIADRLDNLLTACLDANKTLTPSKQTLLWEGMVGSVQIALSPMAALAKLPGVKKTLATLVETSPGFHDADAEILLGTLEAATHKLLGGPDGRARFEVARKATQGRVLSVEVMYARAIAVGNKDRDLFTRTLQGVLDADLSRWPEHRLANEIAKIKAQRYLDAIDTLIPPT